MLINKQNIGLLPVKSIMTTEVISVHPDTLIFDAIELLPKHKISGLPVVDEENNLVGIVTEKDIRTILTKVKVDPEETVSKYMQ